MRSLALFDTDLEVPQSKMIVFASSITTKENLCATLVTEVGVTEIEVDKETTPTSRKGSPSVPMT
eukprot:9058689-Ditylum_brightwellii.AAC.1